MAEYTPTTETFGHGSITLTYYPSSDRIGVEQIGVNSVMDSWELVRFVRELGLLAAHDAEVRSHAEAVVAVSAYDDGYTTGEAAGRAGVVAEEPDWEYGYELIESDTRDVLTRGFPFDTAARAGEHASRRADEEFDPEYPPLSPEVVRRRKAGPWEVCDD